MFQDRKQIILSFFFVICGVYLLRLLYLQVIDDKYLTVGATAVKREVQIPLRGQIYDRNGKLLVVNIDVYDMYVTPYKVSILIPPCFAICLESPKAILTAQWP